MSGKLKTETNTVTMGRRVMSAAIEGLRFAGGHRKLSVDFEHGQWWVTCKDCGGQWSVVDQEGGGDIDGFGFERVTEGEEGICR